MKIHFVEKAAAVACALCLTVGVMRGIVLAKDREAVSEPEAPEATYVVLDWSAEDSAGAGTAVLGADGSAISPEVTDNRSEIPYFVNDTEAGVCSIIDGEPFVDAEELCWALGLAVSGSRTSDTFTLSGDGIFLEARVGNLYFLCNDRYVMAESGLRFHEGQALLPMSAMAKCLGVNAVWDQVRWTVTVQGEKAVPLESGATFYKETDLYWLSRVIYAEAGNQPFTGQLAVGNVVVNRVGSEEFPNQENIYDVIFAKNQFDVVINGMIYMEPDETSIVAAKLALEGYDVVSGATVFDTTELEGYDCVARIGDYCFMTDA